MGHTRPHHKNGWLQSELAPLWGGLVGLLVVLIYWPGILATFNPTSEFRDLKPLHTLDLRLGDLLHRSLARRAPPSDMPRMCVVGITAEDVARYGPLPWDRTVHAGLVRRLAKLRPRVIAFDIYFSDPTDSDADLAAAVWQAGNVVLPRWGLAPDALPRRLSESRWEALPYPAEFLREGRRPVRSADGAFRMPLWPVTDIIYSAARLQGHINLFYDEDLVARRVPVAIGAFGSRPFFLPLGIAAGLYARGYELQDVRLGSDRLLVDGLAIPLDQRGCIMLNYQGLDERAVAGGEEGPVLSGAPGLPDRARSGPVRFFSYRDVLERKVQPEAFQDAVVLVGHCLQGTRQDIHLTPEGGQFGVFVQAALLYTALTGRFLYPVGEGWTAFWTLALSVLVGTVCFRLRFRGSAYAVVGGGLLAAGAGMAAVVLGVGLLRRAGLVLEPSPFLMAIGLNLMAGVAASTARTRREMERVTREMDLLLVAGERQMATWACEDAPPVPAASVPGAEEIALSASLSVRSPEILAESFWHTVPCEGCVLLVVSDGPALAFDRVVCRGFRQELRPADVEGIGLRLGWEILKRRGPLLEARREGSWSLKVGHPAVRSVLGLPVVARGEPLAVVVLFNKVATRSSPERYFTEEDLRLLSALRFQAAALLENARRYRHEYMMFDGFARSLAKAVDFRDRYTHGHSERVAELSAGIARELGLTKPEVEIVQRAATLHDLGKIGVSDAVLNKPGRLSKDEFAWIRAHAANGYEILRAAPSFEPLLPGIRHHHERYDGTGYPDGLAGANIPLIARIIAAADAYDAMTSERIYRKALTEAMARRELIRQAGRQFDPDVVKALLRYLEKRPRGHRVHARSRAALAPRALFRPPTPPTPAVPAPAGTSADSAPSPRPGAAPRAG